MESPALPGMVAVTGETLKQLADDAAARAPKQFDECQRATLVGVAGVFEEPGRLERAEAYFERAEFWLTVRKFGSSNLKAVAYVVGAVAVLAQFKDQIFRIGGALYRVAAALGGG